MRKVLNDTFKLIQAIAVRKKDAISSPMYKTTIDGNNYTSTKLDIEQHTIPQEIVISTKGLYKSCTSSEWHLIGRISEELFMNNCLWYYKPELRGNGSIQKAIKGLVDKLVLWKTDVTHYYFVNPTYIRRGKELEILYTTGQMIYEENGINQSLLKDKRAIKDFDFSINTSNNLQQIQYGYASDESSEH